MTFDIKNKPHDWLLRSMFNEIYNAMDVKRNDATSLWSDYTPTAKEKLMGFVSANKLIDIYRLVIMKQE